MDFLCSSYLSPIGSITLASSQKGLCALCFSEYWDQLRSDLQERMGRVSFTEGVVLPDIKQSLDGYFAGELNSLNGITVDLHGTAFQCRVWNALRTISPGRTMSYRELARAIDCDKGQRAVGAANGSNPVSLIVPCHRVIRSDGTLGGYGGGIERKRWLLQHEMLHASP